MTGQEATRRLAQELTRALEDGFCTMKEYISALPLFQLTSNQWVGNGVDIKEEQYNNVWNVISKDWDEFNPDGETREIGE